MFYKEVQRSSELYERLGFGIGFFQAGTNMLLNGILLFTLYFGGQLLSTGQLSSGDLMAFLMAAQTIQKSLSQLSVLFGTYVRGVSAGARVFQVAWRSCSYDFIFFNFYAQNRNHRNPRTSF